jgi:hypothetical protein
MIPVDSDFNSDNQGFRIERHNGASQKLEPLDDNYFHRSLSSSSSSTINQPSSSPSFISFSFQGSPNQSCSPYQAAYSSPGYGISPDPNVYHPYSNYSSYLYSQPYAHQQSQHMQHQQHQEQVRMVNSPQFPRAYSSSPNLIINNAPPSSPFQHQNQNHHFRRVETPQQHHHSSPLPPPSTTSSSNSSAVSHHVPVHRLSYPVSSGSPEPSSFHNNHEHYMNERSSYDESRSNSRNMDHRMRSFSENSVMSMDTNNPHLNNSNHSIDRGDRCDRGGSSSHSLTTNMAHLRPSSLGSGNTGSKSFDPLTIKEKSCPEFLRNLFLPQITKQVEIGQPLAKSFLEAHSLMKNILQDRDIKENVRLFSLISTCF